METHVKVLGVLQIVMGVMGLCGAFFFLLIFGGAAGIVGASGDPDAAVAMPILGIVGLVLVTFIVVLSLPGIIVGAGLYQRRSWARIGGIVISVFELIMVPFGTIVGIYGLWVLLSKETEPLFAPPSAASVA
jgi:hypothetical protein